MHSFGPMLCAWIAALLVLAPTSSQMLPSSFDLGKEYFFNYAGYALSGRPPSGNYSGFKINATICLYPIKRIRRGFHMQLTIKKARYDQVDGDICPLRPEKGDSPQLLTKENALTEIPVDLSRVVHFNWVSGSVSSVRISKKDSISIANLKKGILNMLNVNLRRVNRSGAKATMIAWQYEDGAEGICKTGYVATKQKRGITLQKIRNLYDCKVVSGKIHRFMQGDSCTRDGSLFSTPLRGESRTTFDLPTFKTKFFLRSSKTVAQYFLPNPNTGCLMAGSYITQELKFDSFGNSPKVPRNEKLAPSSISVSVFTKELAVVKRDSKNLRKKIDALLGDIKKMGNEEKLNIVLRDLVSAMRLASENDLKYTLRQAKAQGNRVETIVLDIFGTTGTSQARKVVVSLILDNETPDSRASTLLRMLAFSTLEAKKLELTLRNLASKPKLWKKDREETLQTIWMMVGTLHSRHREQRYNQLIASWFRKQSKKKHATMDDDAKTTTLLMGIGNSGAEPLLSEMMKRAAQMKKAKKLTLHMRLHGLHAMRKFAARPRLQSKMRTILWPLFANPMEDSELRILAFQYLIKTNPSRRHMSILMTQLRNEPCRHVLSYVTSYLMLLARSGRKSPCRSRMANLVRWALPALPKGREAGMFDSRIMFMPLMKSTGYYVSIIYCTHSPLPRSITIGQLFADDQSEINAWSLTIRSLESGILLRNIAEPTDSIIGRMQTLFKEFKGSKGSKKEAQTTAHFSLSGEDAGYYGTTFLGSKSNPLEAFQKLLKLGKTAAMKAMFMDSVAHLPTAFGTTLNWVGSASSVEQMNSKFGNKEGMQMTTSFAMSVLTETSLGFSSVGRCAHTMAQTYIALHPGKPHEVTMALAMKDMKNMKFSVHSMPHKDTMEAMRAGVRYYQVLIDGSGKTMYKPLYPIVDQRKVEKKMMMDTVLVQTTGISRNGFNRVTRRGERTPSQAMSRVDNPFTMVVFRLSQFCGMSLDFELTKPAGEADPMRTTRIGAIKVKLADVESGKVRGSARRPYEPPAGLRRFAKAEAKISLSFYKMRGMKQTEVKMGVADLKVGGAGQSLDITLKPRMGEPWSLSYKRRVVGALPYYDASNPLTITANSGSEGRVVVKYGDNTIATLTRTSSISDYWVEEWKRLLLNPSDVAFTWPDVYRCYEDVQGKYYDSPSCYRAWRQLQTFDNVSSTVSPGLPFLELMQEKIAQRVSQLYTFIQREKFRNKDGAMVSRISAAFCPSDMRAVDNNRKYYARVLDGYPRWATCTVTYYPKTRQFYTRTFDGLNYIANLPKASTKGKSFIVARDCRRGNFTVSIGSNKEGNTVGMALGNFGEKTCKALLKQSKGEFKFDLEGSGCEGNVVEGNWGQVRYLDLKPLGVKLVITSKQQFYVMVNRMIYLNSLHGFCGNFDREPEHMELLGCVNGKVKYFSNDRKGWDGLLKSYITKDPANYKECE